MVTNEALLPLYIISGLINAVLIIVIIVFVINNIKLGQKEFYRSFIMTFVILSYFTRIAEYIYVSTKLRSDEYNRNK